MKKSILTLITMTILFVGCSKKNEPTPAESKHKGSWSGTYSGGDEGYIAVTVDANGKVTGTSMSKFTKEIFEIKGSIPIDGDVFTGSSDIGTEFSGVFLKSSMVGTWKNTQLKISGSLMVDKK